MDLHGHVAAHSATLPDGVVYPFWSVSQAVLSDHGRGECPGLSVRCAPRGSPHRHMTRSRARDLEQGVHF